MYRETIYKSRDNLISLALEQGLELQSAAGITRCKLIFKRRGQSNIVIDSQTTPTAFDFAQTEVVRGANTRVLALKLGAIAASTPIPDGLYTVDIYLYDAANTNGVFWDSLETEVRTGDAS